MTSRTTTQARNANVKTKEGAKRSERTQLSKRKAVSKPREIAAGEFKAKCLSIIDQVNRTGQEVIITKRGKAAARLMPVADYDIDEIFGRLKGIVEIVGDPDDLVNPIIPLEDWEMLK